MSDANLALQLLLVLHVHVYMNEFVDMLQQKEKKRKEIRNSTNTSLDK